MAVTTRAAETGTGAGQEAAPADPTPVRLRLHPLTFSHTTMIRLQTSSGMAESSGQGERVLRMAAKLAALRSMSIAAHAAVVHSGAPDCVNLLWHLDCCVAHAARATPLKAS